MVRMTDEEIIKVVRTLIGTVIPIADSCYDSKVKDHIEKQYSVISSLLADIGYMACKHFNSPYASEEECGIMGYRILRNLRNEIDEFLSEIEVLEYGD